MKASACTARVGTSLELPSPDPDAGDSYRRLYDEAAAGCLGPGHRLVLDGQPVAYDTSFMVAPASRRRWDRLFGAAPGTNPPFSYYTTGGTVALLRLLGRLGVNMRHLLHLQTSASFAGPVQTGARHRMRVRLERVLPLAEDRAGLVVDVEVTTANGTVVQAVREVFAVLDLPSTWRRAAAASPLFDPSPPDFLLRRPARRSGALRRTPKLISSDLGLRYAELSGDLNTHGADDGAATTGTTRPFLPGLCTANLVIAALSRHERLAGLVVVFARPVFVGQSVELLTHYDGFELRSEPGRLIAFGSQCWAVAGSHTAVAV